MSEPTPPPVAGSLAGRDPGILTPETIDAILGDFRLWLLELANQDPPPLEEPAAEPVDLHTLVGHFIALRHEVNLQTKATRGQQEQNAETLEQLTTVVEQLEQASEGEGDAEAVRPLLKTLIEMYDALAIAGRELLRLQERMVPALGSLIPPAAARLTAPPAAPSRWARFFGSADSSAVEHVVQLFEQRQSEQRQQLQTGSDEAGQLLSSVLAGYTMSLERVDRALRQHGLEPIASVGHTFDPEQMEVVDVVAGTEQTDGTVIEEVRRGYLWNERVFRFAQVRVAKS